MKPAPAFCSEKINDATEDSFDKSKLALDVEDHVIDQIFVL